MPDIDITVVREKSGGIRCIYIGSRDARTIPLFWRLEWLRT